jgi:hypothetical protein
MGADKQVEKKVGKTDYTHVVTHPLKTVVKAFANGFCGFGPLYGCGPCAAAAVPFVHEANYVTILACGRWTDPFKICVPCSKKSTGGILHNLTTPCSVELCSNIPFISDACFCIQGGNTDVLAIPRYLIVPCMPCAEKPVESTYMADQFSYSTYGAIVVPTKIEDKEVKCTVMKGWVVDSWKTECDRVTGEEITFDWDDAVDAGFYASSRFKNVLSYRGDWQPAAVGEKKGRKYGTDCHIEWEM